MPENWEKMPDQKKVPFWFTYGTLGIFFMILGTMTILVITPAKGDTPHSKSISQISKRLIHLDTHTSEYILRSCIPLLERNAGEEDPFTVIKVNWSEVYWRLAANLRYASSQEILKTQIPLLALVKPRPIPIQPPPVIELPKLPTPQEIPPVVLPKLAGDPSVLIYHTHTSESYIPVSGKDHLLNQVGDIVKVGTYLQQALEQKYNIKCVHNESIHDQFPFRESYQRSQLSLINDLKLYPTVKFVLDLHRNAIPGMRNTCVINGKKTATIMLVVGSDKMGLPHPHWKKNLEFAQKLLDTMNLYYPGLCSRIVVSEARYNQHLHDHALIIEFGDQNSQLEEVYRAADLFAEILVLTLNQESSATLINNPG